MVEYQINRSLTKTNKEFVTPFEKVYGKKSNLDNLQIFGCMLMYVIQKEIHNRQKCRVHGLAKMGLVAELIFF